MFRGGSHVTGRGTFEGFLENITFVFRLRRGGAARVALLAWEKAIRSPSHRRALLLTFCGRVSMSCTPPPSTDASHITNRNRPLRATPDQHAKPPQNIQQTGTCPSLNRLFRLAQLHSLHKSCQYLMFRGICMYPFYVTTGSFFYERGVSTGNFKSKTRLMARDTDNEGTPQLTNSVLPSPGSCWQGKASCSSPSPYPPRECSTKQERIKTWKILFTLFLLMRPPLRGRARRTSSAFCSPFRSMQYTPWPCLSCNSSHRAWITFECAKRV